MKENNPLVSVITPSYNSEAYIEQTIESVLSQTYPNWEFLITDDCSIDGTWEILQVYAKKDIRIKIFKLKLNSGAGIARNNSIKHAKGRYIAFLDSDDLWLPEKIEKQVKFLLENDLAFTYSSYQKINLKGKLGGTIIAPNIITYNDLLKTCSIGCLTAIYDSTKIGKVYMPDIRKRQDYGLWLIIFKNIGYSIGMSDVLGSYREHSNSVSSNKFSAAKYHYKILRRVANISNFRASYYFFHYMIAGVIKFLK